MGRGQQAAVLIGALVLLVVLGLGGTYGGCSRGTSATGGADAGQFEQVQDVERLLQGTWSGDSVAFTYAPEGGRGPATLTVGEQDGSELVFTQQ